MSECTGCPSFLEAGNEQVAYKELGRDLGLPYCKTLQIPLATYNSDAAQNIQIQKAASQHCGNKGNQPNPAITRELLGQYGSNTLGWTEREEFAQVPSACSSCFFFVTEQMMLNSIGVPLAGCGAKKRFIAPGQGQVTATNCNAGVLDFNHPMENIGDSKLFGPYNGNVTIVNWSPTGKSTVIEAPVVNPAEYESDAPVTEEDAADGIRAWRTLTDPGGSGNTVLMPIFDPESFDESERIKIPQSGDDEHPELYRDHQGILYKVVILWRYMNETPALNGISGVGKSDFFRYAAWAMQLPFERFSISNSTELDDLQGRTVLLPGETSFQLGRIPIAWGKRCVIVIDEPNVGPPDVWQFLRPLTDNSKQLVLDADKGQRIQRNKYCYMGMAFNPSWDMRNVGTHEISDADGSRLMHIAIPAPDADMEKRIVSDRCKLDGFDIPDELLEKMMKVAEELRGLAAEDAFPIHWGSRQQIKVGRALKWFTPADAYRLAAGDLLDPAARDQMMMSVKSHYDSE